MSNKWAMYMHCLQGHPSVCSSFHTVDSMGFITKLIPPSSHKKILNIGAGEGLETKILKDLGYNPTGVVRGEINLKWAADHYPGIDYIDFDMHDMPFQNGIFDAIYMNQVFEHAYAPFICLLECFSVLRLGGIMYIEVPAFKERHTANDPTSIDAMYTSHHHPSVFPYNVYKQMFEKTGFNIVQSKEEGMWFLLERLSTAALHGDVAYAIRNRK